LPVLAALQAAQKQMPARRVGPLTILGATIAGLRLLGSIWTFDRRQRDDLYQSQAVAPGQIHC
jgi:hypothetical protein